MGVRGGILLKAWILMGFLSEKTGPVGITPPLYCDGFSIDTWTLACCKARSRWPQSNFSVWLMSRAARPFMCKISKKQSALSFYLHQHSAGEILSSYNTGAEYDWYSESDVCPVSQPVRETFGWCQSLRQIITPTPISCMNFNFISLTLFVSL